MTAGYANIGWSTEGHLVRITLKRPPLNVFDIEMMREINAALDEVPQQVDAKVLVFDHEGKAFSAGVDIKDHTADKIDVMMEAFHGMFRRLATLALPTLALVDGAALGGGCELATFCDLVVASDRARFGQPEIQVGVFPPVAAAVLPHLIGRQRTLQMILTGDVIVATRARDIGLISEVFPTDSFREDADAFVGKLTSLSGAVLRLTKRAVDDVLYKQVVDGIGVAERIYLDELMQTEDAQEGLDAFMQKRPPKWRNA